MQLVKTIQINNFKFFSETDPINIDGKNILLYGENGSGKSSMYWALYTLLECANKANPSEIQKYFNKNNQNSLVNTHATVDNLGVDNSYIKITLDNNLVFEVSFQNTLINTNQNAKKSNYVSDFINYRLLQSIHNVKHSGEIEMFPVFEDAVLNYIQFPPVNWLDLSGRIIQVVNAGELWKIIKNGPPRAFARKNGLLGYPLKTKHPIPYSNFRNVVNAFYTGLNALLANIQNRANTILKEKLLHNITFELNLSKLSNLKTTEKNYFRPSYKIALKIIDFNGEGPVIAKPQSFLNEAKLSAISLAIRFAILEQRLQDANIKILVLDDLLVSFDMNNRDRVTNIVLNDYSWWHDSTETIIANRNKGYQTFLLTHDRSYFTFVKHAIENLPENKKETWKIIEMYSDDIDPMVQNDFEKPRIFDYQNEFSIAYTHYKNHDYPASANYLRKYTETILCGYLPEYCWRDYDNREKSNAKLELYNILMNGILFFGKFNIDIKEYKELKKFLKILLNPLSHADVGVERYKSEINQVISILKQIENVHRNNKWIPLVTGGEEIELVILNPTNNLIYVGVYILKDTYYKINNLGNTLYSSFMSKIVKSYVVNSQSIIGNVYNLTRTNFDMYFNYQLFCNKNGLQMIPNWKHLLHKMDGSLIN